MSTAGRKSSINKQDYNTPQKYVDAILEFWGEIDLDPCSNLDSIVPAKTKFILPEKDGLKEFWSYGKIYVNPPFGRSKDGTSIYNWLEKCSFTNDYWEYYHTEVLALIPVATNTKHWKDFIFSCDSKICFLNDTRLKFRIGNDKNAEINKGISIACAMIYWGENKDGFYKVFSKYGNIR